MWYRQSLPRRASGHHLNPQEQKVTPPELHSVIWSGLAWPLAKLLLAMAVSLLFALFIESLNWTHGMARLAAPLIRLGHMSEPAGASFSVSFFSGLAANTMLSEAYDQGKISKRELILANLFNSLPTYFLHLPTLFSITAPLIKGAAFTYVGLTLAAAFLRTAIILLLSRFLLPAQVKAPMLVSQDKGKIDWHGALAKARKRFTRKMKRVILYTVPTYTLIFLLNRWGAFDNLQGLVATRLTWFDPRLISIVIFHVAAESTAGMAAAGALLNTGNLGQREVILALLVGNVLASPMRTIRHQFPYYAGIFRPRLASELLIVSQVFRVGAVIALGVLYYLWTG